MKRVFDIFLGCLAALVLAVPVLLGVILMAGSGLILWGALKMRRLESLGLSVPEDLGVACPSLGRKSDFFSGST